MNLFHEPNSPFSLCFLGGALARANLNLTRQGEGGPLLITRMAYVLHDQVARLSHFQPHCDANGQGNHANDLGHLSATIAGFKSVYWLQVIQTL